ncbi:hypothetical protein JVT61DRAFT_4468 [Boletus reticuloceps]|uniref:DUF7918 domain-containing protein n=1 Tax=Boletus reticuloceps TaxID=495285 RepID=A0A8I3A7B6_9AGAM|nr:hypothetical protein JVT61DRAFT_4468 [Boletus reticuloceps]
MLSLHGVSAWVEVDGKELEQYGVAEDLDQNQVTCWIPSQANKKFSVVFRDNVAYREHSLSSNLELDGSSISGRVILPLTTTRNTPNFARDRKVVQSEHIVSTTSSRPFVFSKLELTEDENEYLNQSSAHLGEIQIKIYKVQVVEKRLCLGSTVPCHGKVHERSKKAVTHCVSYGQEVEIPTAYSCITRLLDSSFPLATFVFKYRDFGLLQANGIIPKPPPAKKKAAVSVDVLDLTTGDDMERQPIGDEIEIVEDTTEKRTASLLSKRSNPSEVQPTKRIKREENFVRGEVIDLT